MWNRKATFVLSSSKLNSWIVSQNSLHDILPLLSRSNSSKILLTKKLSLLGITFLKSSKSMSFLSFPKLAMNALCKFSRVVESISLRGNYSWNLLSAPPIRQFEYFSFSFQKAHFPNFQLSETQHSAFKLSAFMLSESGKLKSTTLKVSLYI